MKKRKIPSILIAVRKGNREGERLLLGDGFHQKERIVRNRKKYSRKTKHCKSIFRCL